MFKVGDVLAYYTEPTNFMYKVIGTKYDRNGEAQVILETYGLFHARHFRKPPECTDLKDFL